MANKKLVAFNISAPTVITPPPLNPITGIVGIDVQTEGSAGSLVLNDCASLAGASIENQIAVIPYQQMGAAIDFPLENGLVISAMPTGAVISVLYTIYVVG